MVQAHHATVDAPVVERGTATHAIAPGDVSGAFFFGIHPHSAQTNSTLSEIESPLCQDVFRSGQCQADSPTVRNFSQ